MQHLDEGTIHAWLDGALDAEESARVEEHARECATCAAAVAEARGLVAGASRILTALDDVPAGVTPRAPAFGGGSSSMRSRSVWGRLHMTPMRAAAAALVFLAAGTVLVVRNAPNGADDFARVRLVVDTSRSRMQNAPQPATPMSGIASAPAPASAPQRQVSAKLPPVKESPVVTDSSTRSPAVASDVVATSENRADVARKALPRAAPPSAAPTPVVGGLPQPARTMAARANFGAAPAAATSFVGCYSVSADSAAALPPQLLLDSMRAEPLGGVVAGAAGRAAQRMPVVPTAEPSRAVAAMVGGTRQPLANASWQPLASGGIRLSVGSPSQMLLLHPSPSADLVGSTIIGGRVLPVVLRRVECP